MITDDPGPAEELKRKSAIVQSYGMKIYDVRWSVSDWGAVTRGLPGRDQHIEQVCKALRAIGAAGVPFSGYTFLAIGHFRTASTTGRGGAKYSTFDYEEFKKNPPSHPGSEISEEKLWENIEYFLKRVIPVAEEAGVRLALHPDDPPLSEPLGGAARIVTSPENYKRIFDLVPSDSNAMLFCQGCFAEMGTDVPEAIRYFGSLNKICMVHFRNIRGNPYRFEEVFIDEGDVDMLRAMQAYHEVGFQGPFLVDHTPSIPQGLAGRTYAIGYIRAMIQAAYR
jgi:mannonate dehydratase